MRRAITETQWNVTLITAGPQTQTLQKNVDAPTQDVAVRRAMQSFPGMNFVQVMATSLEPQQTPPGSQQPVGPQQQLPRQMAGLRQLQGLVQPGQQQQQQQPGQPPAQQNESLDPRRFAYPYTIVLPVFFSRVLKEASPVPVLENSGQYRIVIENAPQMGNLLSRLGKSRNRNAVSAIINGLRSSLK